VDGPWEPLLVVWYSGERFAQAITAAPSSPETLTACARALRCVLPGTKGCMRGR
jgi:hypothetical protein